jgi:hypothetical protein
MQESILAMERELPGLPQFNLSFAFRLQGPLDVAAFERGVAEIVRRHESLRTSFGWKNGRPIASVVKDVRPSLVVEDLAGGAARGGDRTRRLVLRKAELVAEREAWRPFDLARAPLFRMRLMRLGHDDHVLLVVLHHIIIDGWSIGVLFEELSTLYSAFAGRRPATLPAPVLQLADVTRWQRRWCETAAAERQMTDWKEQLQGASPVFPTDRADGSTLLSSPVAYEPVRLNRDLMARLSAVGGAQCATPFMTLLTGFKAMLLSASGRNDICVATAMANRAQEKTERVVGLLENTTIVRTRLNLDLSFAEALDRVRHSVLEAHARQQLPYDILAARMAEEDGLELTSITQAFFILQNAFRPLRLPNVAIRPFGDFFRQGQAVMPVDRTWLAVTLKETDEGIIGSCCYKTEMFEADALQRWIANFRAILAKGAENPEMSLGRLAELGSIASELRPTISTSAEEGEHA